MINLHRNDKKAYIYGFKDGKKIYINFMWVDKNDTKKTVLNIIYDHNNTFLNHAFDVYMPLSISFEKYDI